MTARLLALLLALVVAVGAVAPTVMASPDAAVLVADAAPDGPLDLEPALVAAPFALVTPVRGAPRAIAAPPLVAPAGRLHRTSVFRPPE